METLLTHAKWSPLASGKLARSPDQQATSFRAKNGTTYVSSNPEESEEIIRRVHQTAVSRGIPMTHVALAWLNKRVVSSIIGISSVERMDEALDANTVELSNEEEMYLESPYKPQLVQGHT